MIFFVVSVVWLVSCFILDVMMVNFLLVFFVWVVLMVVFRVSRLVCLEIVWIDLMMVEI